MIVDWDEIKKEYIESKGKAVLKELAEKYKVKDSTLRSRKNREQWDDEIKDKHATSHATQRKKNKNVATRNKSDNTKQQKVKTVDEEIVDKAIDNELLTDKQQLFCIYYIEHFNATKAYQQAYDCSRESARANSSRLLTNDNIKSEIDKLTEECLKEEEINSKLIAKRLFQKMLDIASAELTDFIEFGAEDVPLIDHTTNEQKIDEEGNPVFYKKNYVNFKDGVEVDGTVLSEVSLGKDGAKVKLQDKMKAIQWLSDRIDLLPIAVKEKLQLERDKLGAKEEGQESQDWSKAIVENAKKRREKNERNN